MTTYRLAVRRIADHTLAFDFGTTDGYPAARKLLLGVARLLPAMHQPGCTCYLAAEPLRGQQ